MHQQTYVHLLRKPRVGIEPTYVNSVVLPPRVSLSTSGKEKKVSGLRDFSEKSTKSRNTPSQAAKHTKKKINKQKKTIIKSYLAESATRTSPRCRVSRLVSRFGLFFGPPPPPVEGDSQQPKKGQPKKQMCPSEADKSTSQKA